MDESISVICHGCLDCECVAPIARVSCGGGIVTVLTNSFVVVVLWEVAIGTSKDALTGKGVVDTIVAVVVGGIPILPIRTHDNA